MVKRKYVESPSKTHTTTISSPLQGSILGLIGGVLMPYKSKNGVHLMYLQLGVQHVQHICTEKCVGQFIPHTKNWEDVHCCYSLGHGISYTQLLSKNDSFFHAQQTSFDQQNHHSSPFTPPSQLPQTQTSNRDEHPIANEDPIPCLLIH